jgi:hypothetical protein
MNFATAVTSASPLAAYACACTSTAVAHLLGTHQADDITGATQANQPGAVLCSTPFHCPMIFWCIALLQLAKTKAADIESLLQQLSDINHDMSGVIAGAGDARSHTLARHRDILTDLTQVGAGGGIRRPSRGVGCSSSV